MTGDVRDDVLGRISRDGWDGLRFDDDVLARQMQKLREEARAEAAPIAAVLDSDGGRALIDWLVKKTLLRPPSDEEQVASTVEQLGIQKARRDGQNSVVWMLLQVMQAARGEQPISGGET